MIWEDSGYNVFDAGFLKTPLGQSLLRLARQRGQDAVSRLGLSLPCTVSKVISPFIVEVNFEVIGKWTLPKKQVPVLASPYIAYPIQEGDKGVTIAMSSRLGALSGLGGGTPNLADQPGNLSCLGFVWIGTTSQTTPDPQAVCILEPTGNCNVQVGPTGVKIDGDNGNLFVAGNLGSGTGASGSFTTPTGQTVTVTNGIITNIF